MIIYKVSSSSDTVDAKKLLELGLVFDNCKFNTDKWDDIKRLYESIDTNIRDGYIINILGNSKLIFRLSSKPTNNELHYFMFQLSRLTGSKIFLEYTKSNTDNIKGSVTDNVNHPSHYNSSLNGIETIEAIKATMYTQEEYVAYLKGNVVKYLSRLGKKDETLQDAEKAVWYANKIVEELKGGK